MLARMTRLGREDIIRAILVVFFQLGHFVGSFSDIVTMPEVGRERKRKVELCELFFGGG